jgi:hypothetical protein
VDRRLVMHDIFIVIVISEGTEGGHIARTVYAASEELS